MQRVYSISKDNLRWIRHSVMYSPTTGESYPHPNKVWEKRGMSHIVKAIPESIADCWMILVKDWDGELEEYEYECALTEDSPYWSRFNDLKIVE